MIIENLTKCCAVWQTRLRLADWKIRVEYVKQKDLYENSCGMCEPNLGNKTALVLILNPEDLEDLENETPFPQTVERILVHELLHLHLFPLTKDDKRTSIIEEEQAIECICDALMTAYGDMVFED